MKKVFQLFAAFALIISAGIFSATSIYAAPEDDFVITVDTTNIRNRGSASNQFAIPTTGAGYNYDVDWGDTNTDTGVTGNITHTYAVPGIYTVRISGDFPRIFFQISGEREKILSVEQWGTIQWSSMEDSFSGCDNLVINATDAPDLSNVISMSRMFWRADSLNDDISHWDVSNVEDMSYMFRNAGEFNQPLNNWDVSNVTNMSEMFYATSEFNQDISAWDVSSVTDMNGMFAFTFNFDQPLNNWDVSSVTDMSDMFWGAEAFNQDISAWDVSSVTDMRYMFRV